MPATKLRSLSSAIFEDSSWELVPRKGPSGGGSHSSGAGKSSSSGSSSKSSSSKGSAPPSYKSSTSTFRTSIGSNVAAYGSGSSTIKSIPAGIPFAGRQYDGGIRAQVYGSRRLGSGYPYGGGGFWIIGRPFPYGFWPIYYHPDYYGDNEYGPENNSSRPGGVESTAVVQSNSSSISNSTNTYQILGDADSVRAVLDALVFNCSVVNSTISSYDANAEGAPQPEQAVQYYRASSFVLFLDGYNNTAELASNQPASNTTASNVTADTPLPSGIDETFLTCLNDTIGNAVPMSNGLSLVLGAGAGAPIWSLLSLFWLLWVVGKHL